MEYFNGKKQRGLIKGLTEPGRFIITYNRLVDDLNLLGSKFGIDISKCIQIVSGEHGVAFRITEAVKDCSDGSNLLIEIITSLYRNSFVPLEFLFIENETEEVFKFIDQRLFQQNDSITPGARIIKASIHKIPSCMPYYQTLEDLQLYDPEFLQFKKQNHQFAITISQPENIVEVRSFVITAAEGDKNSLNALLLMHSISGNRGRKYFTGVHHIELPIPDFIKDFNIIDAPDKNGVYTASFLIAKEFGRTISKKKDEPSTMFPAEWSIQQFYFECYHAIKTKSSKGNSLTHYISNTFSGVPVEIIFSTEGKFRTIYPIYVK